MLRAHLFEAGCLHAIPLQGGGSGTPYVVTHLQKFCGPRRRRLTPFREGPAPGGRQVVSWG